MFRILIFVCLFLTGCGVTTAKRSLDIYENAGEARIQPNPMATKLNQVPKLDGKKITVAVYSFTDKTGQRKPADNIANLSSAVTQGSEVWVIKALSEVGNETWFEVLERVGMDNLIKERQLIRNTREQYEKDSAKKLKPMKFAGLIVEGGIIGYDSNIAVGGMGARYLGVGTQTEYRVDTVTVVMRVVSVSSGKVLLTVATEKTIASSRSGADIFKFLDMGTKLIESETGYSVNEPTNYAVRAAIEAAVINIVYEGEKKKMWKFQSDKKQVKMDVKIVKPEVKKVIPEKKKPQIKITKRSVDKDVIPLDMSIPKSKPTLLERMCNPTIMKITDVCASDTEDLRKRLKVGIEKHVTIAQLIADPNLEKGYKVCDKNELCFRNVAEMYRWESWTKWLAHVNEGKNFNLIK